MMTPEFETVIHIDQMQIIDNLWDEFKSTGDNYWQKGYLLGRIPPRLHADWGQSALMDKAITDSLDTVARTNVPALEDSPSIPTNMASNTVQLSASTVVRTNVPTPDIDADLEARRDNRLMPPPQLPAVTRLTSRSASRPIGGRNRSLSTSSNNSTTSKASARQRR